MKKQHHIRTHLNLKQQEIAQLLGISRAQWAMYEIGKRDLPPSAQKVLAELLTHITQAETSNKHTTAKPNPTQQNAERLLLEKMLRENEYQQLLTERKIATATNKRDVQTRLTNLTNYLNHPTTQKQSANDHLHKHLKTLTKTPPESQSTELFELEHRQQLLDFENSLIKKKVGKLSAK